MMPHHPLIIAHKGYSSAFPESTLLSYREAIAVGSDIIELDLRSTRDGVLVIKHERTLSDLTPRAGNVDDYTLDELRQLDFGSYMGPAFAGQAIATLDEVLDAVADTPVGLCIELKDLEHVDRPGYEDRIIDILRRRDLFHCTVINLASVVAAQRIHAKEPLVRIALDAPQPGWDESSTRSMIHALASSGAAIVEYAFEFLTPSIIVALQRVGYAVWAWTVNERQDMERLLAWGVDGILTDDPQLLRSLLLK